ncbi:MAG: hypothetical protein HY300_12845, partial [Verrucomicrobia bacterium]|nr:hypothetical protein [Verrucomicrobiota bacterium]
MEPQPPIPTPIAIKLREFNYLWTPALVFVLVFVLAVFLYQRRLGPYYLQGEVETVEVAISSQQPGVLAEAPKPIRTLQRVGVQEIVARVVGADPKNPIPITSPIEGAVTSIRKIPGDIIAAGEPIMTVSSEHADRVIAFLRQPMIFAPEVGMVVEIRARGRMKKSIESKIAKVGSQLAPIRGSLLPPGQL